MGDDRDAVDAQQRGTSELPPVDARAELPHPVADEQSAQLAARRARDLVAQVAEQELGRGLRYLDGDVADESVGHDHIGL